MSEWVKIGEVGVDGGTVLISDGNYAKVMEHDDPSTSWNDVNVKATHVGFCPGVEMLSGYGDGHYEVFARYIERTDYPGTKAIAEAKIVFIKEGEV